MEKTIGKNSVNKFALAGISALAVALLYTVCLAIEGVYPFGSNVMTTYDCYHQICPFIEHIFDVLDGKSTLFYTYAIAGGADVCGTLLYMFVSPFSFLYLLFGDGNVHNACSVVLGLKVMTIAFVGTVFVKSAFKNIPDAFSCVLATAYAFSGYTFLSSTWVNWTDLMIYLPLSVLAFRRYLQTGKFFLFSLTISACIYTCFSIACFSMFTVFPFLVLFGWIYIEKEKRNKYYLDLVVSFAVGILLSLPVLLPAFMSFSRSGRQKGMFDYFWYGFSKNDGKLSFDAKAYFTDDSKGFLSVSYEKLSYVLSDGAFLTLSVFYLCKKGLKDKSAKCLFFAMLFTLLPAVVDESMLLLNMGSYFGYCWRFGFLSSTCLFYGAGLYLDGAYAPNKEGSEAPTLETVGNPKRSWLKIGFIVFATLFGAVVLGLFALYGINGFLTLREKTDVIDAVGILSVMKNFAKSLVKTSGGLEVVSTLFFTVALALTFSVLAVKKGKVGKKAVSLAMAVLLSVQTCFYGYTLVSGSVYTHRYVDYYTTVSEKLNEKEGNNYFRIKDYSKAMTANVSFTCNSNSYEFFTSMMDSDNYVLGSLFGYTRTSNSLYSKGGSLFGDCFLNYKYFYVDANDKKTVEENLYKDGKGYLKAVVDADTDKPMHVGRFYVYENLYTFPLAFTVKGTMDSWAEMPDQTTGEMRLPQSLDDVAYSKARQQNALYNYLNGQIYHTGTKAVTTDDVIALYEKLNTRSASKVSVSAGKIDVEITAGAGDFLLLPFIASKGYEVFVNGKKKTLSDNVLKVLSVELDEGENTVEFVYRSPYKTYLLWGVVLGGTLTTLLYVGYVLLEKSKNGKARSAVEKTAKTASRLVGGLIAGFFFVFPTLVFLAKLIASVIV